MLDNFRMHPLRQDIRQECPEKLRVEDDGVVLCKSADELLPLYHASLDILAFNLVVDNVQDCPQKPLVGLRVKEAIQESPGFASVAIRTQDHCIRRPGRHCLESIKQNRRELVLCRREI